MAGGQSHHGFIVAATLAVNKLAQALQDATNQYCHFSAHSLGGYLSPEAWTSSADLDGRRRLLSAMIAELAGILKPAIDGFSHLESVDVTHLHAKVPADAPSNEHAAHLVKHLLRLISAIHTLTEFDLVVTANLGKEGNIFKRIIGPLHALVQDNIQTIGDICEGWGLVLSAYNEQLLSDIHALFRKRAGLTFDSTSDPKEVVTGYGVKDHFRLKVDLTFSLKLFDAKFMNPRILGFTKGTVDKSEVTYNPFYSVAMREVRDELVEGKKSFVENLQSDGVAHKEAHQRWDGLYFQSILDRVNDKTNNAPISHEMK